MHRNADVQSKPSADTPTLMTNHPDLRRRRQTRCQTTSQELPPGFDPSLPQPTPGPFSFPVPRPVAALSSLALACQQCAVPAFVSEAVPGRRAEAEGGRGGEHGENARMLLIAMISA